MLAWEEESGAEEEADAKEGAAKEGEAAADGGWVKLPKGGDAKSPEKTPAKKEAKKSK